MKASYSIVRRGSEYRILLSPVKLYVLSDKLSRHLTELNLDISELIIDRISGEDTTEQDVLHDITGYTHF